jgi:hypothetical protein
VYAFMQSAGLVDDHLAGCHRASAGQGGRRTAARPSVPIPAPVKRAKQQT